VNVAALPDLTFQTANSSVVIAHLAAFANSFGEPKTESPVEAFA
jgi:hypothetical protein